MRILFVTNRFPGLAKRGDQQRAWQQLRYLGTRHAITLLSFEAPASIPAEVAACCERVVTLGESRLRILLGALTALWRRRPVQVTMFDSAARRRAVDDLLRQPFDLVHVQLARLGGIVEHIAPRACVLDFVDALSLNMHRRGVIDQGPLAWIARFEARRLAAYERHLCGLVSHAAVCSPADQVAMGAPPNLHRINNGVELDRFPFVAGRERAMELVFVGNLGYFPNVDAVGWFVDHVLPRLTRRFPDLCLRLVGVRPARRLLALAAANTAVELVGPVEDVHPHLARAAVAIVPMRAGSGQQLKLLEAMAAGTPVVASSVAGAGLDVVAGTHLLIADDAEATAAAIERLLVDHALADSLSRTAREFVERHHAWRVSALALEQLWQAAAHS